MGYGLIEDAPAVANPLAVELLERFRAIEELHCAGCGPGHRWPCPTLEILTGDLEIP